MLKPPRPHSIHASDADFRFSTSSGTSPRGDDGAHTGGLAVDTNLGWKGAEKYVATVPQVFDLPADPQERYDIFMTTFTESTWALVPANEAVNKLMKTYVQYPPRKPQSEAYSGPITLSGYERFKNVQDSLKEQGFSLRCRPATEPRHDG